MSTISTKSLVNSTPTIISQPIISNPNILDRLIKIIQQNSQNYSIPTSELPTNYPNNLIHLYNLPQKTSCPHYGTQQDSFLNNNNIYGLPNLDQIQLNTLELAQPKSPTQQVLFPTQQLPTLYRAHARELVFTFLSQQYFLSTQQIPSPYRAHAQKLVLTFSPQQYSVSTQQMLNSYRDHTRELVLTFLLQQYFLYLSQQDTLT